MRFRVTQRNAGRALAVSGSVGMLPILAAGLFAAPAGRLAALPRNPADDTVYTLERVYAKGEVDRYNVKMEVHSDGKSLNGATKVLIALVLKEQTKEVKPDGSAVLNDIFEEGSADMGGSITDIVSFLPAITQTRDKQSRILETKSEGGALGTSDMTDRIAGQLMYFYPSKPIKVGDTWDIDASDTKAGAVAKTKGKGTLVAVEALNGAQTAKIKVVTDADGEAEDPTNHNKVKISVHFDGVGNMDIKTGKMVQMTGKNTFKGGPLTDNQFEWKLKTGGDKDAAPADGAKAAAKGN
jgi:hypothetical protein